MALSSCNSGKSEELPVKVSELQGRIVYVQYELKRDVGKLRTSPSHSLHVMNANGSDEREVLEGGASTPKWLSGGRKVLLNKYDKSSSQENMNPNFKILDLRDNTISPALPPDLPVMFANFLPGGISFSSDRSKVAGPGYRPWRFCIVDLTGKDKPIIFDGQAIGPSWSPDGRRIAFGGCLDRDCNNCEIFVANSDGTEVQQLTHLPRAERDPRREGKLTAISPWTRKDALAEGGYLMYWQHSYGPRWSPDGKRILFCSAGLGIYIMNADGSDLHQIIKRRTVQQPAWSLDGTKVMYIDLQGGGGTGLPLGGVMNYVSPKSNIYVSNADGTGEARVTNNTYPANDDKAPLNVVIDGFDCGQ